MIWTTSISQDVQKFNHLLIKWGKNIPLIVLFGFRLENVLIKKKNVLKPNLHNIKKYTFRS